LRGVCLALFALLLCPLPPARAGGTLVFGMSAAFSGPARGLGMEYQRGIMAAFGLVNRSGGAGGWRLALSRRDDAYGPASALNNTLNFVEKERVFGLLGYVGTPTTARVLPLLRHYESLGVSLFFPLTGADMLYDRTYDDCVMTLRASYLKETRTLVEALLSAGKRRVAVMHQADVYGRNGWDGVRRTLEDHGLSIVAEVTYRRGAEFSADFRNEASLLLAARPDAIVCVGTAPACAAFVRDARQSGYTELLGVLSFADADNMARFLHAQGRIDGRDYLSGIVFSQVVPCYEDRGIPAVRRYIAAMAAEHVSAPPQLSPDQYTPQPLSFVSFEGFLAGMALAEAVRGMGSVSSRQGLLRSLSRLNNVDIGLGERVDLRPGQQQGLKRTYLTIYRDGRFQGVQTLVGVRW
jgi:ABC-type branched-subunit amino acid transport system substrate-binding protein